LEARIIVVLFCRPQWQIGRQTKAISACSAEAYHELMADAIYLDHNATTPIFPEVVDAMRACWAEPLFNPASQHASGRLARRVLEDARERIAQILGATATGSSADRVILTSGGTEANNLAVLGILNAKMASDPLGPRPGHVIVSAIEHPSISMVADHLARQGWDVDRLAVDSDGVIRVDSLRGLLRPETRLVAAMLANNETGVVQPVSELAAICAEHGVPLHTDAAQAAGKLPLSFRELGFATMSIAAHKFGGPLGIGALIVRHDMKLSPQLLGGFHQFGLRAGTESVALAVGMRLALELWDSQRADWGNHLEIIRDHFEGELRSLDADGQRRMKGCQLAVLGSDAERLPNTSNVAFVGLDRQVLFMALDQAGIACSTGSACASGSSEPSPVHLAMGCEPSVISSALRFSFGVTTTLAEVEEASRRIIRICNDLGRQKRG
jgi:cysteine desulfurase